MITSDEFALSKPLIGDKAVDILPQESFEKFTQIIDGIALLQRIVKPTGAKTF